MKRFFLLTISVATACFSLFSFFACAARSISEIRTEFPAFESGETLSFSERTSEENEGDLSDISEPIEENNEPEEPKDQYIIETEDGYYSNSGGFTDNKEYAQIFIDEAKANNIANNLDGKVVKLWLMKN